MNITFRLGTPREPPSVWAAWMTAARINDSQLQSTPIAYACLRGHVRFESLLVVRMPARKRRPSLGDIAHRPLNALLVGGFRGFVVGLQCQSVTCPKQVLRDTGAHADDVELVVFELFEDIVDSLFRRPRALWLLSPFICALPARRELRVDPTSQSSSSASNPHLAT